MDIYLRAAERIAVEPAAHNNGVCRALEIESAIYEVGQFERAFHPTPSERIAYNVGYAWWLTDFSRPAAEGQHVRVVALCFASAMAATGDL